jgi:SAM-dependent methyltransferase
VTTEGQQQTTAPEEQTWFVDHFEGAVAQILEFLGSDGISLEGAHVADVGSGDGIIDLGLCLGARPARLVGFDIARTDRDALLAQARAEGIADELPAALEFVECRDRSLPADDASFDFVVSWSAFEHVVDPHATASEIARVLRPYGVFFLQLLPFYRSIHGSHLWTWFPEGFAQLRLDAAAIEDRVESEPWRSSSAWRRDRLTDFRSLNGVTVDQLQDAIVDAGLVISKVELMTQAFHVPPELGRHRITDLGITGIKLLAHKPPA